MLRKLIEELRAIDDPAQRGRLATETLEHFKAQNAEVAQIRKAAAQELKDQGLTLKEIGERIGPEGDPLHFSRIGQILKGNPTGRWAKVVRDENAAKAEAEESVRPDDGDSA